MTKSSENNKMITGNSLKHSPIQPISSSDTRKPNKKSPRQFYPYKKNSKKFNTGDHRKGKEIDQPRKDCIDFTERQKLKKAHAVRSEPRTSKSEI